MIFMACAFFTSYSPATGMPRAVSSELPRMMELMAASSPVTEADAEDWLASLPENSYSLQLMAVSKEATVEAVIARYPELKKDLRYFRRSLNGKPKFVLLYGSFSNPDSAKAAKSTLPAEFGLSLLRKISAIKKEFPPASKARP
ncbi:MAG: SPOR domain-containing protein [Gammaproteobacteria bacterium]